VRPHLHGAIARAGLRFPQKRPGNLKFTNVQKIAFLAHFLADSVLGPLGEPAIVAIQAAANDARAATAEIHGLLRGGTLDADYSGISAARRMDIEPTSEGGQWSGREKGRSASHMGEFARVRPACIVTQCDWSCLIACAGLASPSRSVQSFGPGPHFSRTACNWVPCYRHHPHFCRCAGVIAST